MKTIGFAKSVWQNEHHFTALGTYNLIGTCQSEVNVVADVLLAQQLFKVVSAQYGVDFLVNTRENDSDAFFLTHQTHVLQVVESRRVDERYLTHTNDAHLGTTAIACHDIFETVTCSKEVRTIDLVDLDTLRNGEVLQVASLHVGILVEVNLVVDGLNTARKMQYLKRWA